MNNKMIKIYRINTLFRSTHHPQRQHLNQIQNLISQLETLNMEEIFNLLREQKVTLKIILLLILGKFKELRNLFKVHKILIELTFQIKINPIMLEDKKYILLNQIVLILAPM